VISSQKSRVGAWEAIQRACTRFVFVVYGYSQSRSSGLGKHAQRILTKKRRETVGVLRMLTRAIASGKSPTVAALKQILEKTN
jgi:hypothetical protein